jgi:hypothetical protein
MGDRVIYTGCTPAEAATAGDVGVATNYPIGLTREEYFHYYWVATLNSLQITAPASVQISALSLLVEFTTATANNKSTPEITRERELVCGNPSKGFLEKSSGDGEGVSAEVGVEVIINMSLTKLYDELYYPFIYVRAFGNDSYPEGSDGGWGFATDVPVNGEYPDNEYPWYHRHYSIPLLMFGKTVQIYGDVNDFNQPPEAPSSPIFTPPTSVTINVLSYWPYAAKDGSPIYSTYTGAQFQSPFA